VAEERKSAIQAFYLEGKPFAVSISKIVACSTRSKAFRSLVSGSLSLSWNGGIDARIQRPSPSNLELFSLL
jgi:hypothetical protein